MKTVAELRKIVRKLDTISDRLREAGLLDQEDTLSGAAQVVDDLIEDLKRL